MIYVDRTRVTVPPALLERAAVETDQLIGLHRDGHFRDQRMTFQAEIWLSFTPHLDELFHGKCAYCESAAASISAADVEHFRPLSQGTSLDGKVAPDHYFWLAYEWRNLLTICQECSSNLGQRRYFPVAGERAPLLAPWAELHETPLLLDPCSVNPEDFLVFSPDVGIVGPRELPAGILEQYGGVHPGDVTIKLLHLNRGALMARRRHVAQEVRHLGMLAQEGVAVAIERLRRATQDDAPYAAVARQVVRDLQFALEPGAPEAPVRSPRTAPSRAQTPAYEPIEIRRLAIGNFRAIEDLDLHCPKRWKVLLGENATGKSTILQAVACALMGRAYVETRYRNGRRWLTRKGGRTARHGFIELELSRGDHIRIEFDSAGIRFQSGGDPVPTFLRAYGTVRLPASRHRRHGVAAVAAQSVRNLFDPHYPLTNAVMWLKSLQEREELKPALIAIRDMLLLDPDAPVDFRRGRFALTLHGERFTSDQLSTGYQDVFNLVADIVSGFPLKFSDMQAAFGIVLMDELGVHLHPRWKMQIVASLRQTFPNIQFIVSTHDPLCLRGLDDDEVAVMFRDSEGVTARSHFDRSPRYMRVDQLLTSSYFGLESTVDPALDAEFREYYALLVKPQLSADETRTRDALRAKLDTVSSHGVTRRDQLLCEILDQQLLKQSTSASVVVDEDTRSRVWARWQHLQGRG